MFRNFFCFFFVFISFCFRFYFFIILASIKCFWIISSNDRVSVQHSTFNENIFVEFVWIENWELSISIEHQNMRPPTNTSFLVNQQQYPLELPIIIFYVNQMGFSLCVFCCCCSCCFFLSSSIIHIFHRIFALTKRWNSFSWPVIRCIPCGAIDG